MDPTRYQVVAGAFGRGLRQDRGLDLEEVELAQRAPGALQQPVPEDDVSLQLRPPEIQYPMLEPELFGGEVFLLLPGDRDGRCLRGADDLEVRHVYLDLA